MGQYFSHDDAFPIIARLIAEVYQRSKHYVTHDELVSAVIADTLGAKLILAAQSDSKGDRRDDWWAANMVAWFSKTITDNQSEYESYFDRKKVKRAWAYRPRDGHPISRSLQRGQNSPTKPLFTSRSQVRTVTPQLQRLSNEEIKKEVVPAVPAATILTRESPLPDSRRLTLFSFGYDGWGNATSKLVQAIDAIEESRGYNPPLFVDIRIRRSVRATGFKGAAFEKLVSEDRHRWMPALGNRQIITRSGPEIQIADPKAASELLELALESTKVKRRLIFFCNCLWPRFEGKISCHRTVVANLVLATAKRRGVPIEVVEWPGGRPHHFHLDLEPTLFNSVKKGRMMIPLGRKANLGEIDGPPTASAHQTSFPVRTSARKSAFQPAICILPRMLSFSG